MLIQQFDYKIASYATVQDANLDEINQADLLYFNNYVDGGIYHSKKIIWMGNLNSAQNALDFIRSKKERKALIKNKEDLLAAGYQISTNLFNHETYQQFDELYGKTTLNRPRALVAASPKNMILPNILAENKRDYLSSIYKNGQLIAGLAFEVKDKDVVVKLGAKTRNNDIKGGFGGILEVELLEFCYQNQMEHIIHGARTWNPVGLATKSGLFEFKARYGFSAYPSENWQTVFIINPKIFLSDVIFVTIKDNQIAYLIISNNNKEELLKYITKDINNLTIINFDQIQQQTNEFLNHLTKK